MARGYGFRAALHVALAEEPYYAFMSLNLFLRAKGEL
jgi:hypothetical protein